MINHQLNPLPDWAECQHTAKGLTIRRKDSFESIPGLTAHPTEQEAIEEFWWFCAKVGVAALKILTAP